MVVLLRNPKLARLFGATVVSEFGSQLGIVAIAFAALHIGGPGLLGVVLAARTVAAGSLMLAGGWLADRWPRHHLMIGADLVRALAQSVTAIAVVADEPWSAGVVVAAQVCFGCADAAFTPSARGLMPRLVDRADLGGANALMGLTRNVVRPVGPAVGGLIVALAGPAWGLAIDAVSFLVGALFVVAMQLSGGAREAPTAALAGGGLRDVLRRDWLLAMMGASLVFQAAVLGPVMIGGPVATASLGSPELWGFLLSAAGFGAVLGSLGAARIRPERPLRLMGLLIAATVPYPVAFALTAPLPVLLLTAAGYGACLSFVGVIYLTVLQSRVPDSYLGRVLAIDESVSTAILPLSQVLSGLVAKEYGVSALFIVSSAAVLLAAGVPLAVPGARRLGRAEDTA